MIIDNKRFDVPTTERARKYLKKQRVRFHLRTPAEGSLPHLTKPGRKKNRMNTGAFATVCAGISGGRIVLLEYLAKVWNGAAASHLYRTAIINRCSLSAWRRITRDTPEVERTYCTLYQCNQPYRPNCQHSAVAGPSRAGDNQCHTLPRYVLYTAAGQQCKSLFQCKVVHWSGARFPTEYGLDMDTSWSH